jgi:hypothetical protein
MMFDTHAYYGQPIVAPPQFVPPGLFGTLPGQYGPLAGQMIAGCLGQQHLGSVAGQPIRYLDGAFPTLVPTAFGPHGAALGTMAPQYGLAPAIGPWPVQPQLAGSPPQGIFGALPAAYGLPAVPAISPWPTQPQLAGFPPQGLFGALPSAYGLPAVPAIGPWPTQPQLASFPPQGLFGALPAQVGHPIGTVGGWIGHPQIGGLAPQSLFGALPTQFGQPVGIFGGVLGQPQLGATLGRGVLPYQMVPQLAYAG